MQNKLDFKHSRMNKMPNKPLLMLKSKDKEMLKRPKSKLLKPRDLESRKHRL